MNKENGLNTFVLLVALIAGFGGFLFGYDSSVIADIKDQVMQQLSLSTWQWSEVVSFSLLGAILGIPLSGLIADKISRRSLLKIVAIGFILGTALCAEAATLNTLLIGRFLIGVCIGVASYVAPLFIAEIAPPHKRGSLILINGLTITFGQAIAYLTGYFLHDFSASSWRIILWIGVIPALILFTGMFLVPHSPRWLMKRHGPDEALQALKKIRTHGYDIQSELHEIAVHADTSRSMVKQLLKPPVLFVLLIGIGLGIFQQFSGINAILYYGPVIFTSAGFYPIKNAIFATFTISVINFIFTAVTLFYIDRFGRRFLLLSGTLIAAISLFGVSLLFHLPVLNQKMGVLFLLSLYVVGYCISVGSLFWVLISEIYPLHIRGLAMSIATVVQWGANFLVSISFLEIYYTAGEMVTFSIFAGMCLLAFVFIYYFIPETTHVSLEKIEENLKSGKKIRDIGQPLFKKKKFKLLMD
ncbi:MAG: sugar porter family MFS transporter [Legionella sp.]|nr:sugar porter family MFS transporter [Legionella sp.]